MLFGYARVSTKEQNIALQVERLREFGCEIVREEKLSGTSRQKRVQLDLLLEFIRAGDALVVTRIDRLARSISDLTDIINILNDKGASLRVTEQPLDTATPQGRLMFNMLGIIAEFENDLRKERQIEGIEAAKRAGKYKGRQPDREREARVLALKADGLSLGRIAKEVGMSRSGVNYIVQKQGKLF
ncbi:recombinase family protein [Saccharibacter sp. EH611]|uniref:recombinase family protein n=1 Tax=unclassified Saccharibacter TaxID=2648722 RepID=UPI0013241C83|nr:MULTISPECIES: recombinase family protein [unclassified Saccharibacter]MXV35620.1 recombinase family protein [Saccharibacter sp. EH611]MXV65768.1 recombinase family protein [Saccharibacter sp. EH60]